MKSLCSILFIFCLVSCNSAGKNETVPTDTIPVAAIKDTALQYIHSFPDSTLENKIKEALLKLSFVKNADAYIDSISKHQHGIAFMMDGPESNNDEIYVKAGYNGTERFETYYSFYVNVKTLDIKVYHAVEDKKMPVKEFIKTLRLK